MASKRQRQVGELIRRHFGSVLFEEGRYVYGDILVTVTNVIMSSDLGLCKIYLSIYNAENKEGVMELINKNSFRFRQSLSQKIRNRVRRIPTIAFYIDETIDEMYRVDGLIDNLNHEEE